MFSRDLTPKALAAGLGFLVWGAIAVAAGDFGRFREAWDSPLYWLVGLPVLAAVLGAFGWTRPRGAWRWSMLMAAGQAVAMIVFAPSGADLGLWPLALAVIIAVSLPMLVPVYLGVLGGWLFRRLGV
jgi:hypothetical protein